MTQLEWVLAAVEMAGEGLEDDLERPLRAAEIELLVAKVLAALRDADMPSKVAH